MKSASLTGTASYAPSAADEIDVSTLTTKFEKADGTEQTLTAGTNYTVTYTVRESQGTEDKTATSGTTYDLSEPGTYTVTATYVMVKLITRLAPQQLHLTLL